MCQQLFVAADRQLPTIQRQASLLVPYPYFGVSEPAPEQNESLGWIGRNVRAILHVPYVYHLTAHLDCGCGFSYGFVTDPGTDAVLFHTWSDDGARMILHDDVDDLGYISVASLARYLTDNLKHGEPLYLYATWSGEEGTTPVRHYHTVTPAYFGGIEFLQLADDSVFRIEQGM